MKLYSIMDIFNIYEDKHQQHRSFKYKDEEINYDSFLRNGIEVTKMFEKKYKETTLKLVK